MDTRLKTGLAFLAAAALSGAALAKGPRDGDISRLDKDGDGKVAVSDLDAHHKEFIAKADKDGDGYLTREEMDALHDARRADREARRFPDANKDGAVDRREYEDASRARFAELDRNGDGLISKDEMRPRMTWGGKGQRDGQRRDGQRRDGPPDEE